MDLLSLLGSKETILLDGAMGTQLTQLCGEEGGHLSLAHPEQSIEQESGRYLSMNGLQ